MTDNITVSRELLRQVLDALLSVDWYGGASCYIVDDEAIEAALTATRAALDAEPARHIAKGTDLDWQAKIFHSEMDKLDVPRDDGEDFYSLWGRVGRLLAVRTSPAPVQEPAFYGFMDEDECCVHLCFTPLHPGGPHNTLPTAYYTAPQPAPVLGQQPVAEVRAHMLSGYEDVIPRLVWLPDEYGSHPVVSIGTKLYTQPRKAVKLSDAAIREAADKADEGQEPAEYMLAFARTIERNVLKANGVRL